MMKARNRFIKNLRYLCLVGVIALGLITIVGSSGGGGGGGGGTSVSTDTGDTDQTDTDTGGGEITPPAFSGFDFTLSEGDFWEYEWDYTNSYWDSFSGGSTSTGSGTFRVTLGSPKEIEGVTAYEVEVTGKSEVSNEDFAPRWKYLAVNDNQILGSEDGTTLVVLFDAQEGAWPGSGFFTTLSADTLFTATEGQIDNDYISGPAITVGQSESESQCEYFPGVGTICGGDYNENLIQREYYRENIGPLGYYSYTSISDMTSMHPWSSSTTINVGLVASSLRGDTVDYELESEPNDSPDTAQVANLSVDIIGFAAEEDEGTLVRLNEVQEAEPNDSKDTAQSLDVPMFLTGDTSDADSSTVDWVLYKTEWYWGNWTDWYVFTLASQATVNIKLNFQESTTANLNLDLIDSSTMELLGFSHDNDPTETILKSLDPGTYIIAVEPWDTPDGITEYTLDLNYGVNKGNEQEVEDWYTFTLSSQYTITVTLNFEGSTTTDFDLYLLNAAADTVLASSREDNPTSGDLSETITETLNPGTYFIGVDAFNGSGDYTLTIQ